MQFLEPYLDWPDVSMDELNKYYKAYEYHLRRVWHRFNSYTCSVFLGDMFHDSKLIDIELSKVAGMEKTVLILTFQLYDGDIRYSFYEGVKQLDTHFLFNQGVYDAYGAYHTYDLLPDILLSECTIEAGLCRHEYRFVDDMRLVILSESVVIKDTVPMYL